MPETDRQRETRGRSGENGRREKEERQTETEQQRATKRLCPQKSRSIASITVCWSEREQAPEKFKGKELSSDARLEES